jgi:hypothetical protein
MFRVLKSSVRKQVRITKSEVPWNYIWFIFRLVVETLLLYCKSKSFKYVSDIRRLYSEIYTKHILHNLGKIHS